MIKSKGSFDEFKIIYQNEQLIFALIETPPQNYAFIMTEKNAEHEF